MKKITALLILVCVVCISCGKKEKIDVKSDFEYYTKVYEKCFVTVVNGVKTKQIDKSLDEVENYIKQEEGNIEAVGKRLNSIILTEKESLHIIRFTEKYTQLTAQYTDYLEANLNAEQKDRFVTMVVEGVGKRMMDQLVMPKNTTDFFKKAIR